MILYRAMCNTEFHETMKYGKPSWNSAFKWFGPIEFVQSRVRDGLFNNSKWVTDRYQHLVQFEIDDTSVSHFQKVSKRELMLSRRKAPLVKFVNVQEVLL